MQVSFMQGQIEAWIQITYKTCIGSLDFLLNQRDKNIEPDGRWQNKPPWFHNLWTSMHSDNSPHDTTQDPHNLDGQCIQSLQSLLVKWSTHGNDDWFKRSCHVENIESHLLDIGLVQHLEFLQGIHMPQRSCDWMTLSLDIVIPQYKGCWKGKGSHIGS